MSWTPETIQAMLAGSGLPVSCGAFPDQPPHTKAPAPPFILWAYDNGDFYADDSNYSQFAALTVELYTTRREFRRETALEQIFLENDLPWQKSTDFLDKHRLHVTTYEITAPLAE